MNQRTEAIRASSLLIVTFMTACLLPAQDRPAFDVASVKPSDPVAGSRFGPGVYTYPGGRVVARNCALEYLVREAFAPDGGTEVLEFTFPNGPKWYGTDRFDIEARPPSNSAASKSNPSSFKNPPNEEQRLMLQTLLAERFQLKFHREVKDRTVYLLMRGKGELKLREPKNKDEYSWAGTAGGGGPFANGIAGMNISMAQFAGRLTPALGRPVLDRTGLSGFFDFKYEYTADEQSRDVTASVMTSLRGLGLKLETATAPIEIIVIDHVEKPSAN